MNATRKQLLVSGIIQLIIGISCLIFGIFERKSVNELSKKKEYYEYLTLTTLFFLGIWAGMLIGITGLLGILTTMKSSFKCMTRVYLGFTITSIVLAGIMIICYSISLGTNYSTADKYRSNLDYLMSILILVLSFLEFGIRMWASVSCCRVFGGRQSQTGTAGQVVYIQTQGGGPPAAHVIIQGPDGNPVAVPAQTSGPMMGPSGMPPQYNNLPVQQPQQNETKVPLG